MNIADLQFCLFDMYLPVLIDNEANQAFRNDISRINSLFDHARLIESYRKDNKSATPIQIHNALIKRFAE